MSNFSTAWWLWTIHQTKLLTAMLWSEPDPNEGLRMNHTKCAWKLNGLFFCNCTPLRKTNMAGGVCNKVDSKYTVFTKTPPPLIHFVPKAHAHTHTLQSLSLLCWEWSTIQIISSQWLFVGGLFLLKDGIYIVSKWFRTGHRFSMRLKSGDYDGRCAKLIFCLTTASVWGHYLAERSICRQILTSWQSFWLKTSCSLAEFMMPSISIRAGVG